MKNRAKTRRKHYIRSLQIVFNNYKAKKAKNWTQIDKTFHQILLFQTQTYFYGLAY